MHNSSKKVYQASTSSTGIAETSTAVSSLDAFPEENLATFQVGESFFTDQYTLDPSQFQQADTTASLPQLGVFGATEHFAPTADGFASSTDLSTTVAGPGPLDSSAENFREQDFDLQSFVNTSGQFEYDLAGSRPGQPHTDFATFAGDVVQSAPCDVTVEPISVIFFFSPC